MKPFSDGSDAPVKGKIVDYKTGKPATLDGVKEVAQKAVDKRFGFEPEPYQGPEVEAADLILGEQNNEYLRH